MEYCCMEKSCVKEMIFLYSTEKSNSITGLERHEGEKIMTEFSFLGKLSL